MSGSRDEAMILFAFTCHPDQGSEPGAGWAALRVAAELRPVVHVITRVDPDTRLEEEAARLGAQVHVHRVGRRALIGKSEYARYGDWVWRAARVAKRLDASLHHHVTFASDWLPPPFSLLRKAPDQRWIWGPVGGSTRPPLRLAATLGARSLAYEVARGVSGATGRSGNRWTLRGKVDTVIALNRDTARAWERRFDVVTRPNAVIDYSDLPVTTAEPPDDGRRIMLFAGRGLDWKGLRFALRAFALLPEQWEMHVAGKWTEPLVRKEGMDAHPRVIVHGKLDRSEAVALMGRADAFMLPSLHDSAPWAAAEAAAVGTPVVCLELGGVAELAASLARPVAATPVGTVIERLAEATAATGDERPAPDRPWTFDAMVEAMRVLYAPRVAAEVSDAHGGRDSA